MTSLVFFLHQVEYDFELVDSSDEKVKKPFCVLIGGIYLEGARWDPEKKLLAESFPKLHHNSYKNTIVIQIRERYSNHHDKEQSIFHMKITYQGTHKVDL